MAEYMQKEVVYMIENDTIRLLRECDSGVKMGISAIEEVMGSVKSEELRGLLRESLSTNESLQTDLLNVLSEYHDDGREPNPIAKGMSWIKTKAKLAADSSDSTVAELMTDGCNMGIKSLSRYLNQYKAADERSKDLAFRLISSEEKLSESMRRFL